jgi:hypothetical protein
MWVKRKLKFLQSEFVSDFPSPYSFVHNHTFYFGNGATAFSTDISACRCLAFIEQKKHRLKSAKPSKWYLSIFQCILTYGDVCFQVELMCNGKTVDPTITLHDLADSWLDRGPKGRVRSAEGAPATGFITTVFYSRPELPAPVAPPKSHNGWLRAPTHVGGLLIRCAASLQSSDSEPFGWC